MKQQTQGAIMTKQKTIDALTLRRLDLDFMRIKMDKGLAQYAEWREAFERYCSYRECILYHDLMSHAEVDNVEAVKLIMKGE